MKEKMTVEKINGNKVTLKDGNGKLMIIIISGRKNLKVGDKVPVEYGKIMTTGSGGSLVPDSPVPVH